MAHHAEPMDVDDESHFDNKENTYQHSNVLPRTPCTEKGYEELDVSELNMKLRYSITPAASPMSKSMSHCLDNRYNTSTDDSLNNTVINDYENNLTRSLNSTLNKTELKTPKVLPLQALPTDIIENTRSSCVLRPLESSVNANDVTITVNNENEIDNLSFPSSSSSMTHTPEATTPTKEIPKHESGSPIMRGLKSVLSIFRSSQSPIPPGDEETKTASAAIIPADIPETKSHAIASTPKTENIKETSLSKRNSPLKESIVFNEDLEKELQWSDDSTIVFSSEKIPIRKLFFQEKSSKPANENVKYEDPNSTVEYMDVSYNDLSIRDKTLNKSKVNELPESDGEFVDCETTFTHNKVDSNTEGLGEVIDKKYQEQSVLHKEIVGNNEVIKEPCGLDTTNDIINMIDSSHIVVGDLQKQLDFSTTDIVNQLSDLINETVDSDVTLVKNLGAKDEKLSEVQNINDVQPERIQKQVTSPVYTENTGSNSAVAFVEQVSINTVDINSDAITTDLESIDAKICSASVESSIRALEATATLNDNVVSYPSPVDIPLPNEDDINEINDNLCEDLVYDEAMPVASTSQNALMATLDKSITEAPHDQSKEELPNEVNACPLSLLSSDVPLPNTDDPTKTYNFPHESMIVVNDPAQFPAIEKSDSTDISTSKVDLLNDPATKSTTQASDISYVEDELKSLKANIFPPNTPSDLPLPNLEDLTKVDTLPQQVIAHCHDLVQENATEKPDIMPIEDNTSKVDLINEACTIKTVELISDEVKACGVATVNTTLAELMTPGNEENMEISYVEPANNKFSESLTMDVSMADATNVEHNFKQTEASRNEIFVSSAMPDLPESFQVEITSTDIVVAEKLDHAQIQVSDELKVLSDNNISEKSSNELVLQPVCVITPDEDFTLDQLSTFHENVDSPPDLKPCDDVEPLSNQNLEIASSSVFQSSTSTEMTALENVANVDNKKDDSIKVSKVNDLIEGVPDNVIDSNMSNTIKSSSVAPLLSEQAAGVEEKEVSNDKGITAVQKVPKDADITVNLDSTQIVENALISEEKVDEEIVISESTSPFVSMSMSAEEACDLNLKKDEFKEVQDVYSTKSKDTPSPPQSPKIVSIGYNLNFDDIDSINPFATKSKIRMSPPPATEKINKTEIVGPLKSDNNVIRRKSMPERKKALKAKRHLNSTFHSTETASPKPEIEPKEVAATPYTMPDIDQTDSNASATQYANQDKPGVALPSEIIAQEDKAEQEQPVTVAIPNEDDSGVDASVKSPDKKNMALNIETKNVEDYAISDGCKPDATSSSEQSTYFSAGSSSNELTESKNVFNLPELDNFNPFVTMSKIRQSPPRELDVDNPFATKSKIKSSPETSIVVSQQDPNSTVTIDNENETKVSVNASTCSASSKASDEKDATVHEIHTEDEDTLEGPFLEADDQNDGDKIFEIADSKVDTVELDNLNLQENEEAAEMFIDAEAFEFLMNQNKTDEVAYSGKESLFLKFDPLFARRVTSEGVSAALSEIKRKQSTPKKIPKPPPKEIEHMSFDIPAPGPSDLNKTNEVQGVVQEKPDDGNLTVSKPMMAVTPAINPVVTPRKSLTLNNSNRLSMTFTSPAMAVIDRLLSLSSNSPSTELETTVTHVNRSHSEADQALTQLRELLAEKEIHVYNLRCESKELKDRLSTLETQMKALEAESAERLKKVNALTENLAEKTKMNRNMAAVVEEYERTIASLISETEQDKKRFAEERDQLIRDRDEQTAHLASMEVSFNDLHSKYEKSKQVIIGYKTNEEAYKKSIQEFEENLTKMQTNYELLKQHAHSKLNHANQELEKINKAHEAEVLKFNAMIKRKELHITSLEESLAQKIKTNEELTAICDELLNKVG